MAGIAELEVQMLLGSVGLTLTDWKGIAPIGNVSPPWERLKAPSSALKMFYFSLGIAHHFQGDPWVVVQFDSSSSLDEEQEAFFTLNFRIDEPLPGSTLLLRGDDLRQGYVLCAISMYILMFGAHAYVVSSSSATAGYVGLQDGFLYFMGGVRDPRLLAKQFSLKYCTAD